MRSGRHCPVSGNACLVADCLPGSCACQNNNVCASGTAPGCEKAGAAPGSDYCTTCSTCSDGVQNCGEAGFDCGGTCGSCSDASCDEPCGPGVNCVAGLTCVGGVCRKPACSAEATCACPAATCNQPCAPPAINCAAGLVCSSGVCRNPACSADVTCICPAVTCGNNINDIGEECDPTAPNPVNNQTCKGLGIGLCDAGMQRCDTATSWSQSCLNGGTLGCNAVGTPNECKFNTASCNPASTWQNEAQTVPDVNHRYSGNCVQGVASGCYNSGGCFSLGESFNDAYCFGDPPVQCVAACFANWPAAYTARCPACATCRDVNGVCQPASNNATCGLGGVRCIDCETPKKFCDTGVCTQCAGSTCYDPFINNCTTSDNNTCGLPSGVPGTGSTVCINCQSLGKICNASGTCVCDNNSCHDSLNNCFFSSQANCGLNNALCQDCSAQGKVCSGVGTCICDANSCRDGAGACHASSPAFCGVNNSVCVACGAGEFCTAAGTCECTIGQTRCKPASSQTQTCTDNYPQPGLVGWKDDANGPLYNYVDGGADYAWIKKGVCTLTGFTPTGGPGSCRFACVDNTIPGYGLSGAACGYGLPPNNACCAKAGTNVGDSNMPCCSGLTRCGLANSPDYGVCKPAAQCAVCIQGEQKCNCLSTSDCKTFVCNNSGQWVQETQTAPDTRTDIANLQYDGDCTITKITVSGCSTSSSVGCGQALDGDWFCSVQGGATCNVQCKTTFPEIFASPAWCSVGCIGRPDGDVCVTTANQNGRCKAQICLQASYAVDLIWDSSSGSPNDLDLHVFVQDAGVGTAGIAYKGNSAKVGGTAEFTSNKVSGGSLVKETVIINPTVSGKYYDAYVYKNSPEPWDSLTEVALYSSSGGTYFVQKFHPDPVCSSSPWWQAFRFTFDPDGTYGIIQGGERMLTNGPSCLLSPVGTAGVTLDASLANLNCLGMPYKAAAGYCCSANAQCLASCNTALKFCQ